MEVELGHESHRLREPLRTSYGDVAVREVLTFRIDEGVGEAAPLEAYDGVPLEVCEHALLRYREVLRSAGPDTPGHVLLDRCREAADLPQAIAAVDLALWDRAGKRAGLPVADLLTDERLAAVPVNATIAAGDAAGAAKAAAKAAAAGFGCVKLKAGIGDDARRVAAVRAAVGPHVDIRLDANGAWDVETAVAMIEALAPAGLELVEEPVHGIRELREVRERVPIRIAMDETTAEAGAIASGAADAVVLKVARAGGIASLLAQAALVRALGGEALLASSLDGPRGIAAAVHAAAALRVELPCGLATLDLFEDAPAMAPRDGMLAVPDRPGLGV